MRIIGNTVGTPLPKSNWKQNDPTKGDYIKNKPEVIDPSVGKLLAIKTIDEDGHITEFESIEVSMDEAKNYTDSKIAEFVGDTPVAGQINTAVSEHTENKENPHEVKWAQLSDKPFGEIIKSTNIVELELSDYDNALTMAKLSESIIEPDALIGAKISYTVIGSITSNGVEYTSGDYEVTLTADNMEDMRSMGIPAVIYKPIGDNILIVISYGDLTPYGYPVGVGVYSAAYHVYNINGDAYFYITKIEANESVFPTIKPIDKKYLPQHDHSWSEIIDAPFGESVELSNILEWDGDKTGKEFVDISEGAGVYGIVKISDMPISKEDLIGAKIRVIGSEGGTPMDETITVDESMINDVATTAYIVGESVFIALEDTTVEGLTLTKGIHSVWANAPGEIEMHTASIETVNPVLGSITIKKLDNKFIDAEWMATDKLDWVTVMEPTECVFTDMYYITDLQITDGDVARITFDGVTYPEGTAVATDIYGTDVVLLRSADSNGNGAQLWYLPHNNQCQIYKVVDGSNTGASGETHTIGIEMMGYTTSKLPNKFLPDHTHSIDEIEGLDNINIAVDSELSDTSENPVQNKVVNAAIKDAKAYTDSEITEWIGDKKVAVQISEAVSSKANASDLTTHTGNTTAHITSTERTNWNAAKSHADSAHAPSGAQANVIESIKVNGVAQTITSKSVNITVPTDNKSLANGAGYLVASDIANKADKATTLAGYGITDAAAKSHSHDDKYYTETEIDTKFSNLVGDTAVPTQVSTALSSAKSYTDGEISKLLNNSTEAIDSIYELRDAMEDNADAISALESIAGSKANASDLTAHTGNKSNPHGVTLGQLGVTASAAELNIMDGVTATTAELNYVDGVTSNIQTQLNAKVPTTRKVNGKALSADITLSASDVGADASGAAASALTSAKSYTDAEIKEWVGDEKVASQISTAVSTKADTKHTHTKSEITDFPTSMPASDVSAWAKAATKPTYTYSEVGADKSGAAATALSDAKAYTDEQVESLVGGDFAVSNAEYATSAGSATQDASGNVITSTYETKTDATSKLNTAKAYTDSEIAEWVGDKTVATQISTAVSTKANTSDLTSHTGNTTAHITSTERTNWNAAKSHADSAHAPSNAEPNQNAFSNIAVGSTTIVADSKTDTLTLAGSNVTITPDATNDKVTIGITKANVTAALGYTPPTADTTYGAAGSSLGLVKSGGDVTIADGVITVNDDSHAHVISNVDGLQSALDAKATASDLSALSGLVGDTAVSTQIETAIAGKADTGHTHDDRYYTESEIDTKLAGKSNTSHTHSAYVNQNAFSNVKVGTTTIAADSTTDTLTLTAGSNITLTPDASGDGVTIAAKDTVYTHPTSGVTAGTYKSVTVDANGHVTGGSNPTTLAGYGITDAAPKTHTHDYAASSHNHDDRYYTETEVDDQITATKEYAVEQAAAAVANKVDKVSGKGLSTNDLTATLKSNYDAAYTHSTVTTGNPHKVTKSDVGLGNVENKSSATIRSEITSANVTTALGFTPSKSDHTHAYIPTSEKGVASGVATLDTSGKVPSSQLPSYVDDVIEGYYLSGKFYKTNSTSGTVITGETGKIYVDLGAGKTYRWSGSAYVVISETLALGENSSTAYAGDKGKANATAIADLKTKVGDTAVATQISNAVKAITLDSIGAAASSHTHDDRYYTESEVDTKLSGKSDTGHTHNYAGSSSAGGAATSANKVNKSLTVKLNSGTTEGTNLFTFDGSAAKSVNITPSAIGAAASSHGTHVTWSTTTPKANGTAAVGSETKVARGDHVHPTDTTRAAASEVTALKGLVGDTAVATQISNAVGAITPASIGAATSGHSHSSYANQNAFSNVKVGSTTIAADTTTDTLTLVAGSNVTLTPDATNDKITIAATNTTYTFNGAVSTIKDSNLTASRALISNSSGKVAVSAVTSTELGYLDGVTSAIQTQLNGKAASSHNHAASDITSGTLSSDRLPTVTVAKGGTGATTAEQALANLGGMSMNLLWTNASPTSSFSSQGITLNNLSQYDMILVYAKWSIDATSSPISAIVENVAGKELVLESTLQPTYAAKKFTTAMRSINVTSNGLSVHDAVSGQGEMDVTRNAWLVPYKVFGIKY